MGLWHRTQRGVQSKNAKADNLHAPAKPCSSVKLEGSYILNDASNTTAKDWPWYPSEWLCCKSPNDCKLITEAGYIPSLYQPSSLPIPTPNWSPYCVYADISWVTRGGNNALWFPADYRSSLWMVALRCTLPYAACRSWITGQLWRLCSLTGNFPPESLLQRLAYWTGYSITRVAAICYS